MPLLPCDLGSGPLLLNNAAEMRHAAGWKEKPEGLCFSWNL